MNSVERCSVCKKVNKLRCSGCDKVYYCSEEHQRQDWEKHKANCQNNCDSQRVTQIVTNMSKEKQELVKLDTNQNTNAIVYEGSSESEILLTRTQSLSPNLDFRETSSGKLSNEKTFNLEQVVTASSATMPPAEENTTHSKKQLHQRIRFKREPTISKNTNSVKNANEQICKNVVNDLEEFGVCVVNNFLGVEKGKLVLEEVLSMYNSGVFRDGQLVSSSGRGDNKNIRGDQITWIQGNETHCMHISQLIREVDAVMMRANQIAVVEKKQLGQYNINGRTKAMVACYPGLGAHYVKHVDNPNKDGRCVTAIYYLNKDWNAKHCGGLLRIFPEGSDQVADIEPLFDRLLFFWSDRRNPHEVQPALQTRYAITLWYFDSIERELACKRFNEQQK